MKSATIYQEAKRDPVAFWEKQARTLRWMKPWRKGLEWKLPYAKWFIGGKLNVSDNCIDSHVDEAAVIGKTHDIKGQAIAAFVTVKEGTGTSDPLKDEIKAHVAMPKTRSGKIMRRLLRDIDEGRALGDTTTLADPAVVAALKQKYEEE